MKKLNFSECTLELLDETFHLKQVFQDDVLQNWLSKDTEITQLEKQVLELYQNRIKIYGHDWNEFELRQQFIGPIFTLVDFTSQRYGLFAERSFGGVIDKIELSGNPDGMIASGFRSPKQPYFCFNEYKKTLEQKGDPAGQCLAPMLIAQEMNNHKHKIYGCYVVGAAWYFMILQGKEYTISTFYNATDDDIFEIFRILKILKQIIMDLVIS